MFRDEIGQTAREIAGSLTLREKAKLLSQIVWETTDVHEFHEKLEKFLPPSGLLFIFTAGASMVSTPSCCASLPICSPSRKRSLLFQELA